VSTTSWPLGPPLLGALLRVPLDAIRTRMLDELHGAGFTDLVAAHLVILRYPGPDGLRPVEVAGNSGMTRQAANYLLGQLEQLGYLERRDDPDDPRAKRIHMTERGTAAGRTIRAAVREMEKEWAQELGHEDLEQLRALLTRLYAVVVASSPV
jgi:DNA-binding MarR family transcriptional regulator